jgi:hypothetical protein
VTEEVTEAIEEVRGTFPGHRSQDSAPDRLAIEASADAAVPNCRQQTAFLVCQVALWD